MRHRGSDRIEGAPTSGHAASDRVWIAPWLVVLSMILAACGGGDTDTPRDDQPAQEVASSPAEKESPTPAPSPTTTPVGGREVAIKDVEEIQQAVHGYFQALGDADFRAAARGSTGIVADLATWHVGMTEDVFFAGLRPASVTLDEVEVTEVEEDRAAAEIRGTLTESMLDPRPSDTEVVLTDISGPVSLERDGESWAVADYQRDGAPLSTQVRRARGRQGASGVVLEAIAFDMRKRGAVLLTRLRNQAGLEVVAQRPRIIQGSGRELVTRFPPNYAIFVLPGDRRASVGIYFPKGHTFTGSTFRFALDFSLGCDPVCAATPSLEFPVRLRR